MRIVKKQSSSKKKFFVTILAIVIGILAILSILYLFKLLPFQESDSNEATSSQIKEANETNNDQKEQFLDDEKNNSNTADPAKIPNSTDTITLTTSQDSSSVTTIAKLVGQGYSSGTCELTVTANGKSNTQSADIIYQPEYSSCAGFSTSINTVGKGSWSISLKVTPLNGSALTQTTTVTVK